MIGKTMLFNPFTGTPRHPDDIKSDPKGLLVWDGEEPLRASAPQASQPPQGAEPVAYYDWLDGQEYHKRLHWIKDVGDPAGKAWIPEFRWRYLYEHPAALAAPPQGASSLLPEPIKGKRYEAGDWSMRNWDAMQEDALAASTRTDGGAAGSDFEQELRSGGRWSPEMIERVAGAEPAIFNAISAYTPPGTHSATASTLPAPQEPADSLAAALERCVTDSIYSQTVSAPNRIAAINKIACDALRAAGYSALNEKRLYAAPAPDSTRGTP